MPGQVLCVNAGSSSLKAAVFREMPSGPERVLSLTVPRLDRTEMVVATPGGDSRSVTIGEDVLGAVLTHVDGLGGTRPEIVAHRFVHGGPTMLGPSRLDDAALEALHALIPWAPLHQPAALAGVERVRARWPEAQQIGCFDTAFHRSLPEAAARLPLPDWIWRAGVRRYGFHGLSYQHIVDTLGVERLSRAVLAHLGNGASLTAVRDGRSVDTTMGFTPDGGVVMGSRTGDLDPGVLLHLLDDGLSVADLRSAVEEHGGLRALSGGTADMRALLDRRAGGDERAELAVETYCRRIRMQIGAYSALLGGVDTVVFTGGIGEHAAMVRDEICTGLAHLGIALNQQANVRNSATIGAGRTEVLIVPADEELVMARQALAAQ